MPSLLVALLAVLVLAIKRAFELVLEKEYATWAPALARLFVRAAGLVYRPRRGHWSADLQYVQRVKASSGLLPAGWCLLSAPGLLLRHIGSALGAMCGRQWEERASIPAGVLVIGVMLTLVVGPEVGGAKPPAAVLSFRFSPDAKVLVTQDNGDNRATFRLWDVAKGKPYTKSLIGGGSDFQFSPDSKVLAARDNGDNRATFRLWDVAKGKPYTKSLIGGGSDFQFSPDGKFLATQDGTMLRLWDVFTGQPYGQPMIGAGSDFQFSPDGKFLAARDGSTVQLWNVATGKPYESFVGGLGFRFSPDGKVVGTAVPDVTGLLWNVAAGQPYGQLLVGAV